MAIKQENTALVDTPQHQHIGERAESAASQNDALMCHRPKIGMHLPAITCQFANMLNNFSDPSSQIDRQRSYPLTHVYPTLPTLLPANVPAQLAIGGNCLHFAAFLCCTSLIIYRYTYGSYLSNY